MDFVTFELAKKLKEKGFNCEYPFAMYTKYEQFCPLYSSEKYYFGIDDFDKHACIAPTISQVLKWLREEKKIHIFSEIASMGWYYTIYPKIRVKEGKLKTGNTIIDRDASNTYDEAILAGIEYALDNLI